MMSCDDGGLSIVVGGLPSAPSWFLDNSAKTFLYGTDLRAIFSGFGNFSFFSSSLPSSPPLCPTV